MKYNSKDIINIINNPSEFGNINNLSKNIAAYGHLEFLEGYLNGIFGGLIREVVDFIDDKEIYNEYINILEDIIKSLNHRINDIDKVNNLLVCMKVVLLHNIYKKKNIYKIH